MNAASDGDESSDELFVMCNPDGHVYGAAGACLTAPTVLDNLVPSIAGSSSPQQQERLRMLRAECHLAAWPLARQSFWLPATATPEGPLEEFAMSILRFHCASAAPSFSLLDIGAEWWANVSREEALDRDGTGDIHLHFDKDERAYLSCGVVVHPLLSTVTYLSSEGAPTVLLPQLALDGAGGYAWPAEQPTALVIPPEAGRHLSFDGRWLHGAPAALAVRRPRTTASTTYERVTFCVNVWVKHRPGACPRFAMSSSSSGYDGSTSGARLARDPPPASAVCAPRLRLAQARGTAARREARKAVAHRVALQCPVVGAACGSLTRVRLRLEQTARPHELLLPCPRALHEWVERGTVIAVSGEDVSLQASVSVADGAACQQQEEVRQAHSGAQLAQPRERARRRDFTKEAASGQARAPSQKGTKRRRAPFR